MMITDELRKLARRRSFTAEELLAIADRIDAEHERKISGAAQLLADAEKDRDYNYANWQDCKQKVLQHNITMSELSAEIERLKDELAHRIELPKDADGEPIHIGDVMDGIDKYNSLREVTGRVVTVSFEADGLVDVAVQARNDDGKSWRRAYLDPDASVYRHHYNPTVEDVLRDYASRILIAGCIDDEDALVAEYAAKLQLRGDAE